MDSHNFLDEYEDEYDDVFYHELKRQVLLLTAEDEEEEEEEEEEKALDGPGARKQGYGPGIASGPSFYFYDWPEIKKDNCVVGLERSGNGTGVFIPQAVQVQPTRKHCSSAGRKKRRITNRRMKPN